MPFLSENVHIRCGRPRRRPRVALGRFRGDVRRGRARVAPARRAVPPDVPSTSSARETRHAPRMPRLVRPGRARGWRGRRRRRLRSRRGCGGTIPRRYPAASHSRRVTPGDRRAARRRARACTTEIGSGATARWRAAATAGGSSTPTPSSCARRSRATRRSCGVRTSSGTDRRARRTPSSPSAEPTTVQEPRVFFATRTIRRRARLDAARPSLRRTAHCCECWSDWRSTRARCGGVPRVR